MTDGQEGEFWGTIRALDKLGLLPHLVVIGSWAEYIYQDFFGTDYIANIHTRDLDFLYPNIRRPAKRINLVREMERLGYVHDVVRDGVSTFYKNDSLEVEFLTRILGAGDHISSYIPPIGIRADGIRDLNIFAGNTCPVKTHGFTVYVPEPACYAIQKILINPTRLPETKREPDMEKVRRLLPHIAQDPKQIKKFSEIFGKLTKRQSSTFKKVCLENKLNLCHSIIATGNKMLDLDAKQKCGKKKTQTNVRHKPLSHDDDYGRIGY